MNKLAKVQNNGSLAKTDMFSDFPAWSSLIDGMFKNDFPTLLMTDFNTGMTLPKVNVRETKDAYFVDVAVPGMKKHDFIIDIDNQVLSISSEKSEEKESTEENYTKREFGYASFKRTFTLPDSVEDSKIKASYTDGLLRVHLPKKEEAKQKPSRTIKIS